MDFAGAQRGAEPTDVGQVGARSAIIDTVDVQNVHIARVVTTNQKEVCVLQGRATYKAEDCMLIVASRQSTPSPEASRLAANDLIIDAITRWS